jgi:dihydroorotase
MKKIFLLIIAIALISINLVDAQRYDIVIKGGHVIDPKNNINEVMDIAIQDGKIARLARNIDAKEGLQSVNARGFYVTPGLIDIHVHVFHGPYVDQQYMNGPNSLAPDGFTFRAGVTTVVDTGSPGWRRFPDFKRRVIDVSRTRVLAYLNIVGEGMRGGPFEQNIGDMNPRVTAQYALDNAEHIVGIKLAHFSGPDWTPTDLTVEAGRLADMPVMIDFGGSNPVLSIEELFMEKLRPGDIFSHTYAQLGSREYIVDLETNKVKPFMWDARKRGIIFEVGHGGGSFRFSQAIPAMKDGFHPDVISTDLHIGSMNSSMKDMLTTMTKFMAMGMDLQSVIEASTWKPAQVINREELGNLSVGAEADVAILNIRKGNFGLFDVAGDRIETDEKLECEMTIRAGRIVYDLNGIAVPLSPPRRN